MKKDLNTMILNGVNIGISKIELDESDLIITDKSGKYCFHVYIRYNWKEINSVYPGTKKKIDFNEYCISENNEPALIWPTNSYIEKISEDSICFNFEFKDLANSAHYMNKRDRFDIELNSLEVKVFIDYKDAKEHSITYNKTS